MTPEELTGHIRCIAKAIDKPGCPRRWYLFGSARTDPAAAEDFDLLIVCGSHEDADAVRRDTDVDTLGRPLHLSILTEAEEVEVSFIENQGCTRIA